LQRIVCDVGVAISGLLSSAGAPAALLDLWRGGRFDLIVSPLWMEQFDRVVARPKIARYIGAHDARELRAAILRQAIVVDDPVAQPGLTPDPGDDYLVALARAARADVLVSGDRHLLELSDPVPPVVTPRAFVDGVPESP
jgi:putative PIN family toxin of toxin-antitoxin system